MGFLSDFSRSGGFTNLAKAAAGYQANKKADSIDALSTDMFAQMIGAMGGQMTPGINPMEPHPMAETVNAPVETAQSGAMAQLTPPPMLDQEKLLQLFKLDPERAMQVYGAWEGQAQAYREQQADLIAKQARRQHDIAATAFQAIEGGDATLARKYMADEIVDLKQQGWDTGALETLLAEADSDIFPLKLQGFMSSNLDAEDLALSIKPQTPQQLAQLGIEQDKLEDADLDREISQQNADTTRGRLALDQKKFRAEQQQTAKMLNNAETVGSPVRVQLQNGDFALQAMVKNPDGTFGIIEEKIGTPVDTLGQTAKDKVNNAVDQAGRSEAAKQLSKTRGEIKKGMSDAARDAARRIPRLRKLANLVEESKTGLTQALIAQYGELVPGIDPSNAQALRAKLQAEIFPVLANFRGALSEKELTFAENTIARLGNTTEANLLIINHMIETLDSVVLETDEFNKFVDGGGNPEDYRFGVTESKMNESESAASEDDFEWLPGAEEAFLKYRQQPAR